MSTPPAPAATSSGKSRKKILGIAIIVIVVVAVLLVPIALAGGFNVPVAKILFNSTTGSLSHNNVQASVSTVTAIEYYFSIRLGGMVRTSDSSNVSSSRGTTNLTITMKLFTPSNQTIDLGKTTINGGIGTRSHTVYLSIDQGVRASGSYRLDVTLTATINALGVIQANLEDDFETSFVIT